MRMRNGMNQWDRKLMHAAWICMIIRGCILYEKGIEKQNRFSFIKIKLLLYLQHTYIHIDSVCVSIDVFWTLDALKSEKLLKLTSINFIKYDS